MKRDFLRSILERTPAMVAGSVVSSTNSSGWPLVLPKVCRNTSGQSEEPPIPSRTACSYSWASRARRCSLGDCSSIFSATFSQPSRSRISPRFSGARDQSVASFDHSRLGASSFWSWDTVESTAGWRVPRLNHCRGPLPALIIRAWSRSVFSRLW